MELKYFFTLLHPTIAIAIVFPLIGIALNRSWLARQRRLQSASGVKSKIPPTVGSEHLAIGYWLTGSVVGVALLGMGFPIVSKMIAHDSLTKEPFRVALVALLFFGSIASMVFLYRATSKLWRGTFATLAGMGLIAIGSQPEIYRKDSEWFFSHYYYGIASALLMIFSVAIVQDIYQDRQNRWRNVHIILNIFATLLFFGQGITGSRDLFFWFKPK
ncbi:DUF4079 domain-containing protein [Pseudanabaena sp. 'Roaring Creek']|uniref:DUF4079 domain-containing protein n=1 Tax=Pseudanabaena sp. 'Roaring Creek' TaxID=1681830 RepID=UPI0006D7C786|nr:DUF4079 domain-containing protein [Pseudanabaena sp. 'Roaring Creek']